MTLSKLDEYSTSWWSALTSRSGCGAKDNRGSRTGAGERVEIYRPLLVDPKEVRKARAAKAKAARAEGDQERSEPRTPALQIEVHPSWGQSGPSRALILSLKPEGQLRFRQQFIAVAQQIAVVPAVLMEGVSISGVPIM
ncbi:MAG: hypothetical protein CM15mP25_4220 [Gammaproteobacteria bacterium]|nr:MAG: hypothetical protein CM15mP25_4220 [Gammaproteobacteria bacterium]